MDSVTGNFYVIISSGYEVKSNFSLKATFSRFGNIALSGK
jgi:hypothetical protein